MVSIKSKQLKLRRSSFTEKDQRAHGTAVGVVKKRSIGGQGAEWGEMDVCLEKKEISPGGGSGSTGGCGELLQHESSAEVSSVEINR